MTITRRSVVRRAALAAASTWIPARRLAAEPASRSPTPGAISSDPDRLWRVIRRAIDAAVSAGASYADVRVTHTFDLSVASLSTFPSEHLGIGVRSLVNGFWGFASSSTCTDAVATRLGRSSAELARANSRRQGAVKDETFTRTTPAVVGSWSAPVRDDPFEVYPYEIQDYLRSLIFFMELLPNTTHYSALANFWKQIKMFGSSAGDKTTQTVYRTSGQVSFAIQYQGRLFPVSIDTLSPAGLGYEHIREQDLRTMIRAAYEEELADLRLPVRPVDVGKYPIVVNALAVAGLVGGTIGSATELDRILGHEANAGGTSYIDKPTEMLGALKIGNNLLNVTAQRSEPGGVATVKWDDEGMEPKAVQLIKDGVLHGFQTNRETSRDLSTTSTGVMGVADATMPPVIFSGNVVMQPGAGQDDFDTLVRDVKDGVAFKRAGFGLDFQLSTGMIRGRAFQVKNGSRVAKLENAGVWFKTSELWNSLIKLGGPGSQRRLGLMTSKGEPRQDGYMSATAVPALFKDASVIDVLRT